MSEERIKCFHCSQRVAVVHGRRGWEFARHLCFDGKPCRGSAQTIEGNWRDDPTYQKLVTDRDPDHLTRDAK